MSAEGSADGAASKCTFRLEHVLQLLKAAGVNFAGKVIDPRGQKGLRVVEMAP